MKRNHSVITGNRTPDCRNCISTLYIDLFIHLFILFIHLLNSQNAPWTFINITQGTKLMGMKATAAISSHHCHWFCWWVTSVFFFFTGASINFTVILLQKVKIPRHLNISRPLLLLKFQQRSRTKIWAVKLLLLLSSYPQSPIMSNMDLLFVLGLLKVNVISDLLLVVLPLLVWFWVRF